MAVTQYRGSAELHLLVESTSGPVPEMNQLGSTTKLTGYVTPVVDAVALQHQGEVQEGMSYGQIVSVHAGGEFLECRFTFIPRGTTYADAANAAKIPQLLATMDIADLPIVQIGEFTDGYNTDSTNMQPWFYIGGAELGGDGMNFWTLTATFRRYFLITGHAAPSAT